MKLKSKKTTKPNLSDRIADALTVKPKADIEDDQVFGTKPQTLTKADLSSSGSEDEASISDFRKRNVNLLSEISKKYEGQVVSRKNAEEKGSDDYEESDSDDELGLSAKDLALHDESSDDSADLDAEKQDVKSNSKQNGKPVQKRATASDFFREEMNSKMKQVFQQITASDSEDRSEDSEAEKQKKVEPKSKPKPQQTVATESDESSDDDGESDDYSITQQFRKQIAESDDDENDGEESEEESGEEGEGYDISNMDEPMKEDFEHVKKQNVSEEAKKGACVRNQLLIWEGLLEMRIHLQRCVATANQMPMPETHKELSQDNEFVEECNATKANIAAVLEKFLNLQNILLKKFPETKTIASKKGAKDDRETQKKEESDEEIPSDTDNEEIPSDTEDEDNLDDETTKETSNKPAKPTATKKRKLQDYDKEITTAHKAFKQFRDSTIQKWNEKTRLATASAIKNKNAPSNTVLQQISYILSDKEKLIRRTQLKRTEYDIVGYKKPVVEEEQIQNGDNVPKVKDRKDDDEYIPEIFDDSDFYHQLLRELIECKSADISDPVQLSRQWIALQQMRSKMKRKVDTKATKGRKIKYVVHNKLVNYMAPEKCTTWTDESTNELYSSLFGKMFENNNIDHFIILIGFRLADNKKRK
ncbi:apoptosis antagonizing transcription factor domain-containing protein [Phthorimaea operculella]|nr:apoptosis antagonizing transcription factor domain-containing protein [Phthorimaea operculella]